MLLIHGSKDVKIMQYLKSSREINILDFNFDLISLSLQPYEDKSRGERGGREESEGVWTRIRVGGGNVGRREGAV